MFARERGRASGSIGSMDGLEPCGEAHVTEVARRESLVLPNETNVIPLAPEAGSGQRRSGRLSAPLDVMLASAAVALKAGEAPHTGLEEGQNLIATEPPEGMETRLHATTREALTAAGLGGGWWGESGVTEQRPEQEEEDPEVVAARKEARDLLRAVPMCVRAWRCQRLGRQHAWTETLATLDVTSKVLLLRNLEVMGGRADPVCLARDCAVDFLGERTVIIAKQPRLHWAVKVSAPLRRHYVIALEPKEVAVACFRLLRAASLHIVPRPPAPKPVKRRVPTPPPPPTPRPPTVCVEWDGPYVGIVPLSSMWSTVAKRCTSFEAAEIVVPKTPVMPWPTAVNLLVMLRRYRVGFGRRWRLRLRAGALIFAHIQHRRGHALLQQRDVRRMAKLCDDMVAELSHRGGLSSTTQAPCESTDSIDLPQTDEPSLQILLAAYVQAVTVEEEEPNKEEVTAVRGRSKAKCEALLATLKALDVARAAAVEAARAAAEAAATAASEALAALEKATAEAASTPIEDANPQEDGQTEGKQLEGAVEEGSAPRQVEGLVGKGQEEQSTPKPVDEGKGMGHGKDGIAVPTVGRIEPPQLRLIISAREEEATQAAQSPRAPEPVQSPREPQTVQSPREPQAVASPRGRQAKSPRREEKPPTVGELAEDVHRQLWSLFWELNGIRQQRGWRVPWPLLTRVVNVIDMHLWHKAIAAMDAGDLSLGQSLLTLRMEMQHEELALLPHVGETDMCVTRVGLARVLVLGNRSMPTALSLLHNAHGHLWALRDADFTRVHNVHRKVWRHWMDMQRAHRRWRGLASKGMRLLLLIDTCEAYKHRRLRCLATGVSQLTFHGHWHRRQREASLTAQHHWAQRRLRQHVRRWRLTALLTRLSTRLLYLRLDSGWRHWRRTFQTSLLVKRLARETAPRMASTCLALGIKARRRAILVEVAAKQEAAKRIKAVTLLQSRMRGMLAGLAVGRNQQELHATYTLRTDATFVVQLPGQPPRRLTATVVSGQARDMRKGLMLRIASKDAGLGGREEGNMVPRQTGKVERDRVYYATISELITLLRGQPPRELRTPLKLQQVCERLWPSKLGLLPGPAHMLDPPAADEWLDCRVRRSPRKQARRMAKCFADSVCSLGLLLAATNEGFTVTSTAPDSRNAATSRASVTGRASFTNRMSLTNRGSVTARMSLTSRSSLSSMASTRDMAATSRASLDMSAHMPLLDTQRPARRPSATFLRQEEVETRTAHAETIKTSGRLCAQAVVLHHGIAVLEEDLLRSPMGSGDAAHALRLSSALLSQLEDQVLLHLSSACARIHKEERQFKVARRATDAAYTEALQILGETCRMQDALKGRDRAKLGPSGKIGLYTYADALAKRRADAQELWQAAQRVSREVEGMQAGMRGYVTRLEDHMLALHWLGSERRAAAAKLFDGAMAWREAAVTSAGKEREDVELDAFRMVCLRKLANSRKLEPSLTKLGLRVERSAGRAEMDAQLWAAHVRSCARALLSELQHSHSLVLSTMVGLGVGPRCRAMSDELRTLALHKRLSYPLYRKARDRRAREEHARRLAEIAAEARRPRMKRVPQFYEQKLRDAVHRPRLSPDDHWKALQSAVNGAQEIAVRLRALVMDYKPPEVSNEEEGVHPLLFKAYGRVMEADNVEIERLKTMQNNMRDDLASLQDMLYSRDIVNAMSLYWGVVGRTYRGETLARNVTPPFVPYFHKIREQMNAEVYQRFQYIIRRSGRVGPRQIIRLPALPTPQLLDNVATRHLGPPLTSRDMRRLRPILPWKKKRLLAAALRIQKAYRRMLRKRDYRQRMLVRLQCWFRSTLAIHLANALRIQRWYRMRCYLRPIEQRAKLKALAEKKLRRQMRQFHMIYVKEENPDGDGYLYRNRMTGQVQWIKPVVFGDPGGPLDAPTPRTHRVIVRLCLSGPQVWYPRKLARRFGVYGGRTSVHELEAATTIKALLRKAAHRARVARQTGALQEGAASPRAMTTDQAPSDEHYSSGVKDLIALTRTRRAAAAQKAAHVQQHQGRDARKSGQPRAVKDVAELLKRWWRRQRARRRLWRMLAKLYVPMLHVQVAEHWPPRVVVPLFEPLIPGPFEVQGGEEEGTKRVMWAGDVEEQAWGGVMTQGADFEGTRQWAGDYTGMWGVDTSEIGHEELSMSPEEWNALTPEQQNLEWTRYYERTGQLPPSEGWGQEAVSDSYASEAQEGGGEQEASMSLEAWQALTPEQQGLLWARYNAQTARANREGAGQGGPQWALGSEDLAELLGSGRIVSPRGAVQEEEEQQPSMSQEEWNALTPEQQNLEWTRYYVRTGRQGAGAGGRMAF